MSDDQPATRPPDPQADARSAENAAMKLRDAATVASSSMRRYPRELWGSVLRQDSTAGQVWSESLDLAARGPIMATWLGHATVLLRMDDKWILTDPVFSQRIGVKVGPLTIGVGRLTPAIDPALLPPLDLVLISHAHFDHLDVPSLRLLANPATTLVTAQYTKGLIPRGFGAVHELAWDQSIRIGNINLRAIRPNHWGARTAWDRHRGFNSYIIQTPGHRVLYAGDTAITDVFDQLSPSGLDLAIFGIGAYQPWIQAHANPEQVWRMHTGAGGNYLMPIHHSTFKLSDEPISEPLDRLLNAAGPASDRIIGAQFGKLWTPSHQIEAPGPPI